MHILRWPALGALLTAGLAASFQQSGVADPATRAICASVEHVAPPVADRPDASERAALAGCVAADLYFGFGRPSDPARARKCAFLEMERGEREPVIGGKALLMMVYANGKGADRNFDVALGLACAIGGAPQDVAGRVQHLARLRAARWTGDGFSICDHSSGRALYEQCAILQERFDSIDRATRLLAITSRWDAPTLKAFDQLRRAANAFFHVHATKESNLEATFEVQERAALEDGLLTALERFEQGDLPGFSAADLRQAEADLDALYAGTQRGQTRTWGTVNADGIRDAQQAWLAYRDAWVAFGTTRYRTIAAPAWRLWLTQERVGMLVKFPQSR